MVFVGVEHEGGQGLRIIIRHKIQHRGYALDVPAFFTENREIMAHR